MTPAKVPTAAVLVVCVVMLVGGALVGFRLLTASADIEAAPTCEDRVFAEGEALTPAFVTVDVYNASRRAGLANRVSINLQRRGFLPGEIGNSDIEVESSGVTIVTDDPEDARVRLVASQFGTVDYVEPTTPSDGDIIVVTGDDTNQDLADDGADEVTAESEISMCVPIITEVDAS
ncbi:LytR C-terminal domain-containing protein [Aeromicrobium sp. CF4.19]|uniref:LytR C-terminal domain-containing protein n=1 Tax=Aeromicrobium sp. CF4.19 TaxID=3373082 RepID=UPI003EE566AE